MGADIKTKVSNEEQHLSYIEQGRKALTAKLESAKKKADEINTNVQNQIQRSQEALSLIPKSENLMSFDKAVEWMENSEIAAKVQNKGFLGMRRFGKYFWYIIEKRGGKTTLLSRDIICTMPYHTSLQDVTWEQCSLREWLNHDFYLSFSLKEMKQIVRSSHANLKNDLYGTPGGVNTNDSIYLLSIAEAERLLPHNLYCGKGWWLRSPGCKEDHAAIITCENGLIIDKTGFKVDMNDAICGVRPAIIIHDR